MDKTPVSIRLRKTSNVLELAYADGAAYQLPAEFLRVHSPSAEVTGHGPEQAVLQWGKRHVCVTGVRGVGHYAIQLSFDDGHDSGIFTWDYLFDLCSRQEQLWQDYLERLRRAGRLRDDAQVITITDPTRTNHS
ncbi:gamma-butyrobetaine hydroxylase-like domain-containing protein [Pseudohongiella sp. O18]|uniref:gamma-butyrobetaine hydroxylase-like domain-containing protein n=1 Tax=Pseudohongiella sp. O18 TaxID=2904248 RepID=UPI001F48CFBE|nr:DUF971 domain-containing protein [Pseudohongiella sp. O18]